MFKHILIPTDGSHLSEQAGESAVRLARGLGARVTVLHVVPESTSAGIDAWSHDDTQFQAHLRKVLEGRGREYVDTICDMAHKAGVACECALVQGESAHGSIMDQARERGCDLIVMASHGRKGTDAVLLASETIKVMTLGSIPVLVHHPAEAAREAQLVAIE